MIAKNKIINLLINRFFKSKKAIAATTNYIVEIAA